MQKSLICVAYLLTALTAVGSAANVSALPLSPFRYEAQAQRHCPDDTVVWLDFRKRRYYSKTQKLYGRGYDGSYVCREEARGSSYRRALIGSR